MVKCEKQKFDDVTLPYSIPKKERPALCSRTFHFSFDFYVLLKPSTPSKTKQNKHKQTKIKKEENKTKHNKTKNN